MDELRKKYKRGQVDKKSYQEKLTELTIFHLEAINYKYVGKIADGTHGVVVEMKSPKTVLNVAVKIAFDDFEPLSGIISWSKLIHENVLPLITWRVIKEASAKVFITVKHDKTLQSKITSFRSDFSGFEKAVNCMKDIANAINYLHHQDLCHLNLSPDRIFVEYNNKAKLGGFGFLTSKDTKIVKFGTTAAFRPPECFPGTNRKIDGQKFDVWSLGILALETFTGHYLSKEMSKWPSQPATWHMQLYGLLYEVLEKDNFNELVKKNFPNWKADDAKLSQALNFIQSCLIFNPEDRPSADNLFELRLLGGYMSKIDPFGYPDVWAEMVSPMELVDIASNNKKEDTSESDSDISDDENDYMNGEHVNDVNVIEEELSREKEKVEKDFEILIQKSKNLNLVVYDEDDSSADEDNKKISDAEFKERDATVKNDNDSCVESYSTEIYTSVYEKNANMKKEEHSERKTKENVSDNKNMSISEYDVKEVNVELEKTNEDIDFEKRLKDVMKNIERLENQIKGNNDMNMSISDEDGKQDKIEVEEMYKDLHMEENTHIMKKKTEGVEIKEVSLEDVTTSNKDRAVAKEKNEVYKNTEDIGTKVKINCIKINAESTEMSKVDLLNMNMSESDISDDENDYVNREYVNDGKVIEEELSTGGENVEEEFEKFMQKYKSLNSVVYEEDDSSADEDKKNSDAELKVKDATVKNDNDSCVESYSTDIYASICEKDASMKKEEEKETKTNENAIDDMNMSFSGDDVEEVNIELEKTNEDNNIKKKRDDIKKKIERLENRINVNDDMSMSISDGDAEQEKNEVKEMYKDLRVTEDTNIIKNETEDVEIKEEYLEDVNISNKDGDVKKEKSEFYKSTEDVNTKRKTVCLKRNKKSEQKKYEAEIIKKKQCEESETSSVSEDVSVTYSIETLHQRPQNSLRKSYPCEKYPQMKEHQLSHKTCVEKQPAKKFLTDNKISKKSSINTCEKRDDTNQKQTSSRTMYASKSRIEKVEQSPATSSSEDLNSVRKLYFSDNFSQLQSQISSTSSLEKQRSTRKTYSHKKVTKESKLSPATSSSKQIQEDENEDLEPGEVPLFRKDYKKVLRNQDPDYSVASLSGVFSSDDEEDLEEGEIGSKNTGSNYDPKPTRSRRRFKHLRSWWKRQKTNLTSCFITCFRTSGVN